MIDNKQHNNMSTVVIEDVHQWSIWCVTESAWITGYDSAPPTTCFTNAAHTVDIITHNVRRHVMLSREIPFLNIATANIDGTTVVDSIVLRDDATNSDVLARNYVSSMTWISPPYPIAIGGLQCFPSREQENDTIKMWMDKDAAYPGSLALFAASGSDVLTLTMVIGLCTGMTLSLGGEALGEIIDVKTSTAQVKMSGATTLDHEIGEAVTYSIPLVRGMRLRSGGGGRVTLGEFTPGSMLVSASKSFTIEYTNDHNRDENCDIIMEYQRGSTNLGVI